MTQNEWFNARDIGWIEAREWLNEPENWIQTGIELSRWAIESQRWINDRGKVEPRVEQTRKSPDFQSKSTSIIHKQNIVNGTPLCSAKQWKWYGIVSTNLVWGGCCGGGHSIRCANGDCGHQQAHYNPRLVHMAILVCAGGYPFANARHCLPLLLVVCYPKDPPWRRCSTFLSTEL